MRIPPRQCTYQSDVERANGIIEYELLEVELWRTKSELLGKTTAWEYYFNRIRPNSYHQNQTPYQRMRKAGISSKQAEKVCLWTVTILDDSRFKNLNFEKSQTVNHVCKDVKKTVKISCKNDFSIAISLVARDGAPNLGTPTLYILENRSTHRRLHR